MTRYGRNTHCDSCNGTIYEGDFYKVHDGETYCEYCWRAKVENYFRFEYLANHREELIQKAAEELGALE